MYPQNIPHSERRETRDTCYNMLLQTSETTDFAACRSPTPLPEQRTTTRGSRRKREPNTQKSCIHMSPPEPARRFCAKMPDATRHALEQTREEEEEEEEEEVRLAPSALEGRRLPVAIGVIASAIWSAVARVGLPPVVIGGRRRLLLRKLWIFPCRLNPLALRAHAGGCPSHHSSFRLTIAAVPLLRRRLL